MCTRTLRTWSRKAILTRTTPWWPEPATSHSSFPGSQEGASILMTWLRMSTAATTDGATGPAASGIGGGSDVPTHDDLHRTVKLELEEGRAGTVEEAQALAARYVLQITV